MVTVSEDPLIDKSLSNEYMKQWNRERLCSSRQIVRDDQRKGVPRPDGGKPHITPTAGSAGRERKAGTSRLTRIHICWGDRCPGGRGEKGHPVSEGDPLLITPPLQ